MEITQIIPHVEALIFAADRPLPALEIVELLNTALGFLEDKATLDQVEAALEAIVEKYQSEFYAFEVRQSGGGYQFLTKPDYYSTVASLNGDKYLKKLSTAALETLAIIAYKQPVSKGEIEAIRGVSSDYSIQKLLEKELILISGRSEELPGKPLLYAVSRSFMDYFGINSPEDLPKIKEVLAGGEEVMPTSPGAAGENGSSGPAVERPATLDEESVPEEEARLIVSENGTLTILEAEESSQSAEEGAQSAEDGEQSAGESGQPTEENPAAAEAFPAEEEAFPTEEEAPPAGEASPAADESVDDPEQPTGGREEEEDDKPSE